MEYFAKNFCETHYNRNRKGQDMDLPIVKGRKKKMGLPRGQTLHVDGYIRESHYDPSGKLTHSMQHRLIVERFIGRKLLPEENVHHINGDRSDNRIENLELWNTHQPAGQRPHEKLAWAKHIISLYGDFDYKKMGSSSE